MSAKLRKLAAASGYYEPEPCRWCGADAEFFDVLEWYAGERTLTLHACCEQNYGWMLEVELPLWTANAWRAFLWASAGIVTRGVPNTELGDFRLDYGLTLGAIKRDDAKEFVRRHHRHASNPPCSWRWGHAVYNGAELVGVAMVGRPVARRLDHTRIVEVNRCCVLAPALEHAGIAKDACSMLYAAAATEARRRGFERILTYVLESESGVALRAAGWTLEPGLFGGGSWNRKNRPRTDKANTGRKRRWCRVLREGAE
jgi:hypothetical protein